MEWNRVEGDSWRHTPCGQTAHMGELMLHLGKCPAQLDAPFEPAGSEPVTVTQWRAFYAFHQSHPEVLTRLKELVDEWLVAGGDQLGIEMLWNVLRWQTRVGAQDGEEPYRLNNNYKAFYARLLVAVRPDWGEVFQMRGSHADDWTDQLEELADEWRNR